MRKAKVLSPFAKPRAWRRGRAHPARRDVAILDRPPLAQIDIYEECVILTRRRPDGTWNSYPVSPDALAAVLGRLPVSTGLLPADTLAAGQHRGHTFYVQYIRARRTTLQIEEHGQTRQVQITIPPLIWAGWQREYRIWAIKVDPYALTERRAELYVAPFPNVYDTGKICWGSARPKLADPQQMTVTLRLFLEESVFNAHVAGKKSQAHPASILRHYDTLQPDQPYPLADLVRAQTTLTRALEGGWL